MAYIGNSPANVGNYQIIDDISGSFNGSQTSFALASGGASMTPTKSSQLIVNISGVMQQPDDSATHGFLVNSNNIVFSSAPLAADTFWGVYQGQSVDIGTPSDDVVDTIHIKDGAITGAKIAAGTVVASDIADDAVTEAKLANSINTAIAANTAKTGITTSQANAITANTAKTGITSGQATAITAALPKAGGTVTGNILHNDNIKNIYGTGTDANIYSDGQNLIIEGHNADSEVQITSDDRVIIGSKGWGESFAVFNDDGAVSLYYDNTVKFATTSAGVAVTGGLSGTTAAFSSTITSNGQAQLNNNNLIGLNTGATSEWIAKRTSSGEGIHITTTNASGADTQRLAITSNADTANFLIKASNVGIGTTSPTAKLEIAGASNTVGSTQLLRLGESAFRVMTGGEEHMLCLDRDNAGGTKQVMQSWNPDNGNVAIGSAVAVAAGRLMIKSSSLTQAQLKLQGLNYSFGAEIMSQNGSEAGTVGNTRCWFKTDLVTNGNVRRFWTASSQAGTDTQSFSIANNQKMHMSSETIKMNHTNLSTAQDVRFGNWVGNGTGYGVKISTGSPQGMILIEANVSTARDLMHFNNSNGLVGKIQTNGTSTSYITSSDHRLKENVDYTWDATTRLKQLKPARFNFIADDTNTLVDGFLAHEVGSIVPEAITGTHNGMKDEEYETTPAVEDDGAIITPAVMGTRSIPDYQGIDQSKLVPLLVKTIQELEARLTAGGL